MNTPFLVSTAPGKLQRGKYPAGYVITRTTGTDDALIGVTAWFKTEAEALASVGEPGSQIRFVDGLGAVGTVRYWWAFADGWQSALAASPTVWKLRPLGSMPFNTTYEVKMWWGPFDREILFEFRNTPAADQLGVFKTDLPRMRVVRTVFIDQGDEFLNAAKLKSLLVATLQAELPWVVVTQDAQGTYLTSHRGSWMVPRSQWASWEWTPGVLPDQAWRARVVKIQWTGYNHSAPGVTTIVFADIGFGMRLTNTGIGAPGDPVVVIPNTTYGVDLVADWVVDIDYVPFALVQMGPLANLGFSYDGGTIGYFHYWNEKAALPTVTGVNAGVIQITDNFQRFSAQV